ncbi:hypothetical protein ACF3NA_09015 [Alkanindiges sp. WGS2144]|uniref:hypothetical protein n=1 Tax=Alkanindiges sp. WGS2144 TaxID=3366808 RepID=UPI003753DC19
MSQTFDTSVPTLKHQKLLATAEAMALQNDKIEDPKTLKQATDAAVAYFEQYRYWWVNDGEMIFDRETGLLWQGKPDISNYYSVSAAKEVTNHLNLGGLSGWKLPTKPQLMGIAKDSRFPLHAGSNYRLLGANAWLVNTGAVDLDYNDPHISSTVANIRISGFLSDKAPRQVEALIIALNSLFNQKPSTVEALRTFTKRKWSYKPYNINDPAAFNALYKNAKTITELPEKVYNYKPELSIAEIWQSIDYTTTRLPKIDTLCFIDVKQGMWEFYAPKALQDKFTKVQTSQFFRDRNPALDIREASVAIDFGTSSTVVAIRANGKDELLRIGMQEKHFAQDEITDQQYENPTVLEFIDLQEFLNEWKSEVYRPLVDWNNIHCSHEARANLRKNDTNSSVVSSILLRLKQWALRGEQQEVRIRDQQEYEYQLKPLTEYNPVKGKVIELGKDYPELDPIEIYAWFLGMNINWRARGIFLNYYLTFPVEYPNDIKNKILAAFRRGLQRSLPEALLYDARINEFSVEELASEPAAFAAAALERLEIEPDDGGVSYAVFDFGGGTTDFDYGFYRLPTDEEEDEGWDHVIEHFGSSGDKFLGGENLLENLAYLVFQANASECRKKNVAFTKPLDADSFAGSELLIEQTQAAYTNTTLMMSKLRPLWEAGKIDLDSKGTETFKLMSKDGKTVDCEININQKELITFLENRIRQGLKNFFIALKGAFRQQTQQLPELVHILLAGNSSRSSIVLGLLGCLEEDKSKALHDFSLADRAEIFLDDNEIPIFEIHLPLDADPKNPYAPTAKTGVALGLLRLGHGERLKVINHAAQHNTDSPFQYFVGAFKRDIFQVALARGQNYEQWIELGKPLNGVLVMGYTTAPQAAIEKSVKRGETGLFEHNIRLSGNIQGHRVFAKVISPNEIEICTALDLEAVARQQVTNSRVIDLS